MIKTLCLLLVLQLSISTSNAQYKYPNIEDQEIAKQLRSKYDADDKICGLRSSKSYTFKIDKPEKNEPPLVTSQLSIENEIISLKDKFTQTFAEFYDSFSNIFRFRVWYKYDKNFKLDNSFTEGTIADLNYSSDGIFSDDVRYKNLAYPFKAMGDVIKFSYLKSITDVKYLTSVFFNDHYPIEEKIITFEIPDWLTADLNEFNFEGFDISTAKEYDANKKVTKHIYTMRNCHSIKQDKNAPSATKNWPHIIVVVRQFEDKGIKYNAFNSVDNLYEWYSKLISKVNNNQAEIKPLVSRLTAGKTNDIDKIKSIYYWVQDNIRYIAFESGIAGFQPANADHVYKNKYGDCKGMANLLFEMLKICGYDSRLTWIGTTDIPYDFSLPSLCVNNHMICALFLNDSLYFLDGTESYISFGDYAHRIQGRPALIQDGKSFMIKYVPSFPMERNTVLSKRTVQIDGEILKGTTDITYNGESKTGILRTYNQTKSNIRQEVLEYLISGGDKNYNVSSISTSDLLNREVPVNFKYNFELNNNITSADNELYLVLELDHPYSDISIEADRDQDFVFHEKVLNKCETEFSIPAGYAVKYIPEPVYFKHPDYSLHSEYKQSGDKIFYNRIISFDNGSIKKKDLKEFSTFIKKMKTTFGDPIILTKN